MEAEDFQGALKILDDLKNKKKLSATESVQLYRIYGVVYFKQERIPGCNQGVRNTPQAGGDQRAGEERYAVHIGSVAFSDRGLAGRNQDSGRLACGRGKSSA